jgi:hypothetical protein
LAGLELFANQVSTTVTSGGTTAPAAGTSQAWTMASSAGFPAASSTSWPPTFFRVTDPAASSEKMIVTNVSGTTWTVTRGAEGTTPVVHASGFTVQNVITAAALEEMIQGFPSWVNVTSFGAVGDGATDNTAAFEAAIASVTPADGVYDAAGTVFVPGGQFVAQPLVLPQRVGIAGSGFGSTLVLAASSPSNSTFISNSQDAGATGNGAQGCSVRSIRLDLNASNRSGSAWDCGIVFQNTYTPTSPYEYSDARHVIDGVLVQYATGDGIVATDSVITNSWIWSVGGFGFVTNNDAHVTNCDAGGCGIDGYFIGGSSQLSNCKAWYCGGRLTSGQYSGQSATATTVSSPANTWDGGSGITYSLANGYGNGFLVAGDGNYAALSNCYAQDNARAGYLVGQTYAVLSGCTADSNSNNGTSNGTSTGTPVGSYAGFDIQSAGAKVDGQSFDRGANLNHQAAAAHITEYTTGGTIDLSFSGTLNDGSNMPPLMAGDVPQGIGLTFSRPDTALGGGGAGGYFAGSTSGASAIDPYYAQTWDYTLTGAATLGNPALTGTNTTGTFLYQGMRLKLIIRQGATVYALAWGTAYNVTSVPSSAPDSVSILDFIYDGSVWQQAGGGSPTVQVLATTFPSGTGTAAQSVTGMAVNLQPGTYMLRARFWYTAHGTTGSTQTFAWTFGGTTSAVQGGWQFRTAAYTAPVSITALTTSSGLSPVLTTATYPLDFEALAIVTAAGTLQLTVTSTTSGDEVSVLDGSYLEAQLVTA